MKLFKNKNLSAIIIAFVGLFVSGTTFVLADSITRQLQMGMSGADVGIMQSFFSKDTIIYPQGLVTNYFGIMTKAAVMNFQARNGIATAGRVGPATLPVLNSAIASGNIGGTNPVNVNYNNVNGVGIAPTISGVNVSTNGNSNSVNIAWNTNESAQGLVYYSSSPLSLYENTNSVSVSNASTASTNSNYANSQNVYIQNLSPNTTYYYLIYVTDQSGNVSVYGPSNFRIN